MADCLVEAKNRKGFGMTTGILEAGSTLARILPMASNKVLPEILIPGWLFAASETRRHRLDFCQLLPLGHLSSHVWLSDLDGHSGYKFNQLFGQEGNVSPLSCGGEGEFCFKIEA